MDPSTLEHHIAAQIDLHLADLQIAAVLKKKSILTRLESSKQALIVAQELLATECSKNAFLRSILLS